MEYANVSPPEPHMVRIHLQQAILVGYGKEARYAKVLLGRYSPSTNARYAGEPFLSVDIIGFVREYQGHNLEAPTHMLLPIRNVLSIEDAKVERTPLRCALLSYHAAHAIPGGGYCPGVPVPYYMRLADCDASVYHGTPESLWEGPGQHKISRRVVERAQRIIQLQDDGRYRIVKSMETEFDPKNEVIFLYDEGTR